MGGDDVALSNVVELHANVALVHVRARQHRVARIGAQCHQTPSPMTSLNASLRLNDTHVLGVFYGWDLVQQLQVGESVHVNLHVHTSHMKGIQYVHVTCLLKQHNHNLVSAELHSFDLITVE